MKKKIDYPWITKLGLTIVTKCPNSIPGIDGEQLKEKLLKLPIKFGHKSDYYVELFSKLYGCQTCGENGMYVYDVEAVLERMFTGKLIGTQHPDLWD